MIILKDVPFERRAKFLHHSLSSGFSDRAFGEVVGTTQCDLADGLHAHHDLLGRIYSDSACVEGKDDTSKYLNLIATMSFLYGVFAFGALDLVKGRHTVVIDKARLKQVYKKGSLARRQRHLEHHGFSIRFLSEAGEPASQTRASQLAVTYRGHPGLLPALKRFAEDVETYPDSKGLTLYNKLGMFMKGDFEAAVLRKPVPREGLDPLGEDILSILPTYQAQWRELVERFRGVCGLACTGFWTYGGTPSWGVSFAAKGKRPLAIFTLGLDIVFIEFTLPLDVAEQIIRARRSFSDPIRQRIEAFHCVKCPKDCKGTNLLKVDGVTLCTGRAEGRRIYTTLSSPADFGTIHTMLNIIC